MTRQVLIVGDRRDAHLLAVLGAMHAMGGPEPVVLDAPSLATERYAVETTGLHCGTGTLELSAACRGWLRRSAPTLWGAGTVTGSLDSVRHRAFLSLVASIARLEGTQWLTHLDDMLRAEDRLLQLAVVSRLGYRIPRTVVTSCHTRARETLGESFVVKPLGLGYFHAQDGPRAVFATQLRAVDLDRVDFADAPFVAQETIVATEHLRVVTVEEKAWVARLGASGRPLDWRRQDEAHVSWVAVEDDETAAAALAVATEFDLGYSSQDWIRGADGVASFVDLNPGGQWLFLPDDVATPVTDAIATYLAGPA